MLLLSKIITRYEARRLKNKKFIVVSNNCWGCDLYKSVGREYNMPFVGLFFDPDSYLKLLEDLEENLSKRLEFVDADRSGFSYPLGVLAGDIQIHFMHYGSEEEARAKWERRTSRLLDERKRGAEFFVKFCDGDGCTQAHLDKFAELPLEHKLSLGVNGSDQDGYLSVPRMQAGGKIFNGQKLFEYRYCYFDVTRWILTGEIGKTFFSRVLSVLSCLELWVYKVVCFIRGYTAGLAV